MSVRQPRPPGTQMSAWRDPKESRLEMRANDTELAVIDKLAAHLWPGSGPNRARVIRYALQHLAQGLGVTPDDSAR